MSTAMFADIHGNRQALAACLADATRRGAATYALLGDYVGYGADPGWVVDQIATLAGRGAIAVCGNHDAAVADTSARFSPDAQTAIEWTRRQLGAAQRAFLANLPMSIEREECLYVHASADRPGQWNYVADAEDAARSFAASSAPVTFCGHIHRPRVFSLSATGKVTAFTPVDDVPIPLLPGRRWLIVLGAVGQPRDGRSGASWAQFDVARREVVFRRTAYDVDAAAEAIHDAGLPDRLAERLYLGM